ncbi:MAG: S-layer homology domain-containing protein [Peptostreptococcaceae bacterium]
MKLKKYVSAITLTIMILSSTITVNATTDIKNHWAENTINSFIENGYMQGYEDGTFRPDRNITRAEFVTIFNKYFGLSGSSGKVFNDTKDHWAKDAIDIAVTNGVCQGLSDVKFSPNNPITRQEVCVMIANYRKLNDKNHNKVNQDLSDRYLISSWAKDSVEGMIERNYMTSKNGMFRPKDHISRAEVVSTLSRVHKDIVPPANEDALTEQEIYDIARVKFMEYLNLNESDMRRYEINEWNDMWLTDSDYYTIREINPDEDGDRGVVFNKENLKVYSFYSSGIMIEDYSISDEYLSKILNKLRDINKLDYAQGVFIDDIGYKDGEYMFYVSIKEGIDDNNPHNYLFRGKYGEIVGYSAIK